MADTNALYNAITDIDDKYILETEKSLLRKKSTKPFRVIATIAAAVIIIVAGIFAAGVITSAAWDDTVFGYIRRMLDPNLKNEDYFVTKEEISAYAVKETGFIMEGEEYSPYPTVKELLIHGWKITDAALEIGDLHEDGRISSLIDSYYLIKDDLRVCVCLNWDDLMEGKGLKECRVGSIYLGNVDSFILDGNELAGISDEQLILMSYYNGFSNKHTSVDIMTGDPCVFYSYNIANDNVENICLIEHEDTREIKVIFDLDRGSMAPGTIISLSADVIRFGYRGEDPAEVYEIPNSNVYSENTPEVGDIIYVEYNRSAPVCIVDETNHLDEENYFVSRTVSGENTSVNDQPDPLTIESPELKMITESGLLDVKDGWVSETEITTGKDLRLAEEKVYIRFDDQYYNYKDRIYFHALIWQSERARSIAWAISEDKLFIDLNPELNVTDLVREIPYEFDDAGRLILEIGGTKYSFVNYDQDLEYKTEHGGNTQIFRGPVSRKSIDGDIYAVIWDKNIEPEYIKDRCETIWKYTNMDNTLDNAQENASELKRPIRDAIKNRNLYFISELPESELERAGTLEALIDEIIYIENYEINNSPLASSDGGGMLIGYGCHADTDEEKDTISLSFTFVYNYDPWKSLDSSITDPEEMCAKMQTDTKMALSLV